MKPVISCARVRMILVSTGSDTPLWLASLMIEASTLVLETRVESEPVAVEPDVVAEFVIH